MRRHSQPKASNFYHLDQTIYLARKVAELLYLSHPLDGKRLGMDAKLKQFGRHPAWTHEESENSMDSSCGFED